MSAWKRLADEVRAFACTCTPLNRRLMAHLLKVTPGSVHEQGCLDRAVAVAVNLVEPLMRVVEAALEASVVIGERCWCMVVNADRDKHDQPCTYLRAVLADLDSTMEKLT